MIDYTFTPEELALVNEALIRAATRHESESRFNPRVAKPHDDKARKMRALNTKLLKYAAASAAVLLLAVAMLAPASAGQRCQWEGRTWVCCNSGGWGCQ
jgi:hypothetical protein